MRVAGGTVAYCPRCGYQMRDAGEAVPHGAIGVCDCCLEVVRYVGGPFAELVERDRLRPADLAAYCEVEAVAIRLRLERAGLSNVVDLRPPPRGGVIPRW